MREYIQHNHQHKAAIDTDGAIECPVCNNSQDGHLHPVTFRTSHDYMETDFWCEHHQEKLITLRLNFHKGKTYMFWLKEDNGKFETKINPYHDVEIHSEYNLPF